MLKQLIILTIKKIHFMEKEFKSLEKETYISPDIEVMNIETEQNILASGSGDTLDMPSQNW